jgi:co-chaperonin GroES (HSP10)
MEQVKSAATKLDWFNGYTPFGATVILQIEERTAGGIILAPSSTREFSDKMLVVATGESCTKVKAGDFVIGVGNVMPLYVEGKEYIQAYESGIMGRVDANAIVSTRMVEQAEEGKW